MGEDIDDFALCLFRLVQQMMRYGDDDIDEEKAVEKFLCVVPKYTQVALMMETLLDLSKLPIEELTERLKVIDDREQLPSLELVTIGGKLLFTEEYWLAH
jgi:hypothetical protein